MRLHSDEVKNKILIESLQMLNESGYGGLALSELARRLKISKQRLYYHYSKPSQILLELTQTVAVTGQKFTVQALAESNDIGAHRVLAMNKGLYDWIFHNYEFAKVGLVIFQSGPHIKEIHELLKMIIQTGKDRIKNLLKNDSEFLSLPEKKIEELTLSLHASMYGFYFYSCIVNDKSKLELFKKNCDLALISSLNQFRNSNSVL